MSVNAQNARSIGSPEVAYDKVIYSLDIATQIRDGQLVPIISLRLQRARCYTAGNETIWEIDPTLPVAVKSYIGVDALTADVPAEQQSNIGSLWDAMNAVVAAINVKYGLV